MNTLPVDLSNIIFDYKAQLEHTEKHRYTLRIIRSVQCKVTPLWIGYTRVEYEWWDWNVRGLAVNRHCLIDPFGQYGTPWVVMEEVNQGEVEHIWRLMHKQEYRDKFNVDWPSRYDN